MGENGALGSAQYGIAYPISSQSTINFDTDQTISSVYFTNNAYAYHSMLNGDTFAKKFGGATSNDADWFKLTITGKNAGGSVAGEVEFYLADYRFANNNEDYIVDSWTPIDLSGLGEVRSIEFALSSSDTGQFGMNTPAYFAMDNLVVVPEPSVIAIGLIGGLFAAAWQFQRWRKA